MLGVMPHLQRPDQGVSGWVTAGVRRPAGTSWADFPPEGGVVHWPGILTTT